MATELTRWPEFNGANAISFPRRNGTKYLLFGSDASSATIEDVQNNRCEDMTRVIWEKMGNRAVLLGTFVNPEERGQGLGLELIDYFVDGARECTDGFESTGLVGKPIFAKQLTRLGFIQRDDDFIVAITPRGETDDSAAVPNVIVLHDRVKERNRRNVMNGHGRHKFYNEVARANFTEQQIRGMGKVALHTKYDLLSY